jgi:hypothetical protein
MGRHAKKALEWIVGILNASQIPFVVTGGLAARAYGSNRALQDIDISINRENFGTLCGEVSKYVFFGPKVYKDDNWNIYFMSIEYQTEEIDICSSVYDLYDSNLKKWVSKQRSLNFYNTINLYDITVPVVPKAALFEEKIQIGRSVDQEDLRGMALNSPESKNIIDKLVQADLPSKKYAVFGSGPMAIRGMRESCDLDLVVSQDLYDLCLHSGWVEKSNQGVLSLTKDSISLYSSWEIRGYKRPVNKLISTAEIIAGYPFVNLDEVVMWKKAMARDKDIKDIQLISDYLKVAQKSSQMTIGYAYIK